MERVPLAGSEGDPCGPVAMSEPYYEHGGITIYHGDCRDVLPGLEPVDLVLTDPPYGVGFRYESYNDTEEVFINDVLPVVEDLTAKIPSAVCMSMRQLRRLPDPKWIACWYKPAGTTRSGCGGFSAWEPIFLYGGAWDLATDVFVLPKRRGEDKAANGHPCPKPVQLYSWLGRSHKSSGTILDPFMGSGTTLRAAKDLGRKAIGIEIEERYCEIAANRLAQGVLDFGDTP